MAADFDPYHKWLGIPEGSRPPTHYQLLAVQVGEKDVDVINAAVVQRSAYVRNFQTGKFADDATRLLNEIAAAKACLLDSAKRAVYDAELKKKEPPKPRPRQVAPAPFVPAAPSIDPLLEQAAASAMNAPWAGSPLGQLQPRSRGIPMWQVAAAIGGTVVVVLLIVTVFLSGGDPGPIAATNPPTGPGNTPEATTTAASTTTATGAATSPSNSPPADASSTTDGANGATTTPESPPTNLDPSTPPAAEGAQPPKAPPPIDESWPFTPTEARRRQQAWLEYLGAPARLRNPVDGEMELIPPGKFQMGSPPSETYRDPSETLRQVMLSRPFWLGRTEFTVAQFRAFAQATGHVTAAEKGPAGGWGMVGGNWVQRRDFGWKNMGELPLPDQSPVVQVTWDDAVACCQWLSMQGERIYRLPTEAEWEYACRAGAATSWHTGDLVGDLHTQAWVLGGAPYPQPVAGKAANPFGLFDMHGNVQEWCADWHASSNPPTPMVDPTGPPQGTLRGVRGGSYGSSASHLRSAACIPTAPNEFAHFLGFRVVAEEPGFTTGEGT
jgi:sulfatase modifying factor 1